MKPNIKIALIVFLLFAFLAGIYAILTNSIDSNNQIILDDDDAETLQNKNPSSPDVNKDCPDLLIKRGEKLLLYNTKVAEVAGVNPLPFDSLDDYKKYADNLNKSGMQCPILFLQEESDLQGKDVLRMRPSPFYTEGGLPPLPMVVHNNAIIQKVVDSSRENPPYNANNYAGFDPHGQYVGRYTNIDEVHNSTMTTATTNGMSDNPMDPNWGGISVTQQSVDSGKYKENEVRPAMYPKMPSLL
jgi:hypothetical protein